MNRKKVALLSAMGFAFSGLAIAPMPVSAQSADAGASPTTVAKLPAGGCSVGGKCFSGKKKMNFSDEQLEKLSSLKTKMRETSGPKMLELKKLKGEIRDKLTKSDVNKDEILAIQSKINGLKAELSNDRISFMVDASQILTEEQKQTMRRKMLMKILMGHHRGHKRFHGKRSHHGKGFKKMRSDAGADNSVADETTGFDGSASLG